MTQHIPFPSINQFRNVINQVRRQASFMGLDAEGKAIFHPAPVFPRLVFQGTVKLHGTNAAVVFHEDQSIAFQSRERVLTLTSDNAGFYAHMSQQTGELLKLKECICSAIGRVPQTIAVYGEWCGGNIQGNVAITGLPKMFVIFAIKVDDEWLTTPISTHGFDKASIFGIANYKVWTMSIDFERPEESLETLIELTNEVEKECPVGAYFKRHGVGEGIVWRCVSMPSPEFWFKVKGEKHSASKVKTLVAVNVDQVESVREFVSKTVTEARLDQGLTNLVNEKLKPFDMTSLGDFIRWVHGDVVKEESDLIEANGLDKKQVGSAVAIAAKRWYVEKLNTAAFA